MLLPSYMTIFVQFTDWSLYSASVNLFSDLGGIMLISAPVFISATQVTKVK